MEVRSMSKKVVVALGGNAILQAGQEGNFENQYNNIKGTAKYLAKLIKEGYELVIMHGNGPQVGNILLQNEEAKDVVPALPLDAISAESQGFIGYMMIQALEEELNAIGVSKNVVNLITRTVVSKDDADFDNPSKPIGPFYPEEEANRLAAEKGWVVGEDAGRGYRRLVPSPQPLQIIEADAIKTLAEGGSIVVAAGGGGIPVSKTEHGYVGVDAVIDKDRSGYKLSEEVDADVFMILTDVEHVFVNWGTPEQKALETLSIPEMEAFVAEGQFAAGSMGPKVEAALDFAKSSDKATSIICSLEKVDAALRGESGTIIR